jgi:hypothetical protein
VNDFQFIVTESQTGSGSDNRFQDVTGQEIGIAVLAAVRLGQVAVKKYKVSLAQNEPNNQGNENE